MFGILALILYPRENLSTFEVLRQRFFVSPVLHPDCFKDKFTASPLYSKPRPLQAKAVTAQRTMLLFNSITLWQLFS
jgi:hypothetical protein